jgi:hypothetical protein
MTWYPADPSSGDYLGFHGGNIINHCTDRLRQSRTTSTLLCECLSQMCTTSKRLDGHILGRHGEGLASGDFRADFSKFRQMGSNKPLIVLRLLEKHALGTVILSDVDTVWMRNPSDFLLRHPTADILISTDCLSHWIEAQQEPGKHDGPYFHRCGHLPGASFGRAFNTGVAIFRNRCDCRA